MHSKRVHKFFYRTIPDFITNPVNRIKFWWYCHRWMPARVCQMRSKKTITVVFAIANLGAWKTELLYRTMLAHPRFNPQLVIIKSNEEESREEIIHYLRKQNYSCSVLSDSQTICNTLNPDIIFYQKPYEGSYHINHRFSRNKNALLCYIGYGFRNTVDKWATDEPLMKLCWKIFYENSSVLNEYRAVAENHCVNGLATGIPAMDELLMHKNHFEEKWKYSGAKKRIIYAPHHSINPENSFQSSTFLQTGRDVLDLAIKYSDRVQWVFKPHPLLRAKLERYWGKEETDAYYNRWAASEWSQFENGKYIEVFKHSDAMIHDCGSYTVEYMYTGNPVLLLKRNAPDVNQFNEMTSKAREIHYQAYDRDDIEKFILNVINDNDPLAQAREQFKRDYLIPPGGHSACENIIAAILGIDS